MNDLTSGLFVLAFAAGFAFGCGLTLAELGVLHWVYWKLHERLQTPGSNIP